MSEQSIAETFQNFCNDVVKMYAQDFLNRRPTKQELSDIVNGYNGVGLPGCAGAIDCIKLYWKNCPFFDKGQYLNTKESTKLATISCEAWCDNDLYCWHWYPGRAGTNNDLTVLYSSPLFRDIMNGYFKMESQPTYKITSKGEERSMFYLLVDGIYPSWPFLVKPIHTATSTEVAFFSSIQEAKRKDIERLFGVLQARFAILRRELKQWDIIDILNISNSCVILHNMIVRIQQEGCFYEEVGESDVITELLGNERAMTHESRA